MALATSLFADASTGGRKRTWALVAGGGDEQATLAQIATEVCMTARAVLTDIIEVPQNLPFARQLCESYALPYMRDQLGKVPTSNLIFLSFLLTNRVHSEEEARRELLAAWKREPQKALATVLDSGTPYHAWKVAFGGASTALRLRLGVLPNQWNECRAAATVAAERADAARDYRQAVVELKPHLEALEGAIAGYEAAAERWTESPEGQSGLEHIGRMALLERAIGVYAERHADARMVHARVLELVEQSRTHHQRDLLAAVQGELTELRIRCADPGLNNALHRFLCLWNPSDHFYFHTIVANSVDTGQTRVDEARRFDERVFAALTAAGRYLALDDEAAASIGREAVEILPRVREHLHDKTAPPPADPKDPPPRPSGGGILSTLAHWANWAFTVGGNFEGPPSLLSLYLTHLAQNDRFVKMVRGETLIDASAIVFFGIDQKLSERLVTELKKRRPDLRTVSDVIIASSWRSSTICAVFGLLGTASLVYHTSGLQSSASEDDVDESLRNALYLVQDVTNLALVALTAKRGSELTAMFTAQANTRLGAIASALPARDGQGFRVAVRSLHATMATAGVLLAAWDAADAWRDSDTVERLLGAAAVGASVVSLLGALGLGSALGPAGLVAGLALATARQIHASLQSGFAKMLRAQTQSLKDSLWVARHAGTPLRPYSFWEWLLGESRTFGDLAVEVREAVAGYGWKTPERNLVTPLFRAGLDVPALARVFECDEPEIRRQLRLEERVAQARREREQRLEIQVLSPPAEVALPLTVPSAVDVAVTGSKGRYVWLEPLFVGPTEDRADYLASSGQALAAGELEQIAAATNSYDAASGLVVLERWSRSADTVVMRGHLVFYRQPPYGRASFRIYVPADDRRWQPGRRPAEHGGFTTHIFWVDKPTPNRRGS